jgi:hypothetical protein
MVYVAARGDSLYGFVNVTLRPAERAHVNELVVVLLFADSCILGDLRLSRLVSTAGCGQCAEAQPMVAARCSGHAGVTIFLQETVRRTKPEDVRAVC